MRPKRIVAAAILLGLVAVTGCSGGGEQHKAAATPGQPAKVVLWHGYTDAEAKAIKSLVKQFNATDRDMQVTAQFQGNNDYALQKVLTAVTGGKYRTSPTCTAPTPPRSPAAPRSSGSPTGSTTAVWPGTTSGRVSGPTRTTRRSLARTTGSCSTTARRAWTGPSSSSPG
jgi:hypothetical protein